MCIARGRIRPTCLQNSAPGASTKSDALRIDDLNIAQCDIGIGYNAFGSGPASIHAPSPGCPSGNRSAAPYSRTSKSPRKYAGPKRTVIELESYKCTFVLGFLTGRIGFWLLWLRYCHIVDK